MPLLSSNRRVKSVDINSSVFTYICKNSVEWVTATFSIYVYNFRLVSGRMQRAKKVVSNSPGLVDFAIGLVNSVFNLPDGQVMFFEEFE